jgi:[ribosomal protein S18]-alanine N-acetyltransferase
MTPISPNPSSGFPPVPIRAARVGDSPGLAALHARAFEAPWSAKAITALLESPGVFALATTDGAGFALARAAAGEAELLTLAVDPVRRRAGVGAALLEAVISGAAALGAVALHLEVAVDNAAAIALYERAGFGRTGRRRGYYERADGRVDALVMTLVLNSPPA